MNWGEHILEAVDRRVAAAIAGLPGLHPATMSSRDSTGSGGSATFFGSGLPVPVKVPYGVDAFPGDAVGLARFGPSDWIVVYSFGRWGASEASLFSVAGNGSTSSATYAALPSVPTFTFRKRYDDTRVDVLLAVGNFTASAPNQGEYAVQLDDGVNPATDYFVLRTRNEVGNHLIFTGGDTLTGVAAGLYTATVRWRRTTGTLTMNNVDPVTCKLREVGPLHP